MTTSRYVVLVLLSVVVAARAQVYLSLASCPTPSATQNFSVKHFMGSWYEVSSIPNILELRASDVTFTFMDTNVNNGISLDIRLKMNSVKTQFTGSMHPLINNTIDGKYSLSSSQGNITLPKSLIILGTDYKSYAVGWSCEEEQVLGVSMSKHWAWIYGRNKKIDNPTYHKVITILEGVKVPVYLLKDTIQCSGSRYMASFLGAILSLVILQTVT